MLGKGATIIKNRNKNTCIRRHMSCGPVPCTKWDRAIRNQMAVPEWRKPIRDSGRRSGSARTYREFCTVCVCRTAGNVRRRWRTMYARRKKRRHQLRRRSCWNRRVGVRRKTPILIVILIALKLHRRISSGMAMSATITTTMSTPRTTASI